MNLSEMAVGQRARVLAVAMGGADQRRLIELGVRSGAMVEVVRRAPFGGPLAIRINGGLLALRTDNARDVLVSATAGHD
ncbi:MAG: FeoA family protein [Frankiaceae bacterium]